MNMLTKKFDFAVYSDINDCIYVQMNEIMYKCVPEISEIDREKARIEARIAALRAEADALVSEAQRRPPEAAPAAPPPVVAPPDKAPQAPGPQTAPEALEGAIAEVRQKLQYSSESALIQWAPHGDPRTLAQVFCLVATDRWIRMRPHVQESLENKTMPTDYTIGAMKLKRGDNVFDAINNKHLSWGAEAGGEGFGSLSTPDLEKAADVSGVSLKHFPVKKRIDITPKVALGLMNREKE